MRRFSYEEEKIQAQKISINRFLLLVASIGLAACQQTPTTETEAPVVEEKVKVCQITDTGGIDDKSFNETAWNGILLAKEQLGVEGKYLESKEVADYEKFLNAFLEEECDLIITVGFLIGDATKAAAEANPDAKYSIVDYNYDPAISNVVGQIFNTDEAGVLAGYLCRRYQKDRHCGYLRCLPIPPSPSSLDGFRQGCHMYNESQRHGCESPRLGSRSTGPVFSATRSMISKRQ